MSTSAVPTSPAGRARRLLVAIGMVGSPLCISVGNLLLPDTSGSPAQQLQTVHAHLGAYLTGTVVDAAGFALLGALGVGVAMLVPHRGGLLATIAAILSLIGGIVMGAAVLVTGFVDAAIPVADARVLTALQSDAALGTLFDGAIVAAVGGLLGVIALLIGRPVPIWMPILLLVGLVLAFLGGGPLGAALSIPTIVAAAALAGALIRVPAPVRARASEPVAA